MSHPTGVLYRQQSLLPLPNINVYMVGVFVYKCVHDENFVSWFGQRVCIRITRSTEEHHVAVPQVRTEHSQQCMSYRGPTVWNSVSSSIREKSYNLFKIAFKSTLLSNQNFSF